MYSFSNFNRDSFFSGKKEFWKYILGKKINNAPIKYGNRILDGLILLLYSAIISLLSLSLEVKKITETKVISPLNTTP